MMKWKLVKWLKFNCDVFKKIAKVATRNRQNRHLTEFQCSSKSNVFEDQINELKSGKKLKFHFLEKIAKVAKKSSNSPLFFRIW